MKLHDFGDPITNRLHLALVQMALNQQVKIYSIFEAETHVITRSPKIQESLAKISDFYRPYGIFITAPLVQKATGIPHTNFFLYANKTPIDWPKLVRDVHEYFHNITNLI